MKDNKPYIIDICRRVPGDLYINLVKHATGVDYPAYMVKGFTGISIDDLSQRFPDAYYTRHVIMGNKNGIFKSINFDRAVEHNFIDKFIIIKEGAEIADFITQCLGIIFLRYDSKRECEEKNKRIQELIKVEVGG